MGYCNRIVMVMLFVSLTLGTSLSVVRAQGNVDGTTYTSPQFDIQVHWDLPWYFNVEGSEGGIDYVQISDGTSIVQFRFIFEPGVSALEVIELINDTVSTSGVVTNIMPLVDAQGGLVAGGDATHAWSGILGTYTLDDGSLVEYADYHDVTILSGGVVQWVSASSPSYFYDDSVLLGWQSLITTAVLQPETMPSTNSTALPANTTAAGEPAPAFAAGPWRIAVRAVDQGESISYLGLNAISGMQWVVVYADVTNWSETTAELELSGMTLSVANGPGAPDQAATLSAATLLGLEPINGNTSIVAAGVSTRLVSVYSIPLNETDLVLSFLGTQLPMADAAGQQLDVTDLSTLATPPNVQSDATLGLPIAFVGPPTFMVHSAEDVLSMTMITLAGVEIPSDACFDSDNADETLIGMFGTSIWLETDPAFADPDSYYVWYMDDEGNRVLLNQELVAKGLAVAGDLPDAARFGAWIEQSETVARGEGVGLWSTCAGQL